MNNPTKKRNMTFVLTMLMLAMAAVGQQRTAPDLEVQLKAASQKELVDGDLKGAIEMYQKIVASAGANKAAAAKALVEMGRLYEKQGNIEARNAYERVVREFGSQTESVRTAQARLKVLEVASPAAVAFKGPTWLQDVVVAISQDGRRLLGGKGDLRDLVTGEQRQITDSKDFQTSHAAFSPDGQQIAYSPESQGGGTGRDTGPEIRTASLSAATGQGKLVFRNEEFVGTAPFGWSPDGKEIFAVLTLKDNTNVIAAISAANGSFRRIKSLEWRWPDKLSLSPDGRYIAYDTLLEKDSTNRDIFLLSTDGSGEKPLVQDPARDATPVWTPDGKAIVFTTDRSKTTELWTVQVADGKPKGTPELLRPKERRAPTGPIFPIGFSADGSFYYSAGSTLFSDVYTAEIDLAAETVTRPEARIESFAGRNAGSAYSPDGKRFAYFSRRGATFNINPWGESYGFLAIVVRTLATGEEREIPTIFTSASSPAWMPDGRSLVFAGHTDADLYETYSLHQIDLNTGKDLINRTVSAVLGVAVSPDGKKIYYTDDNPQRIMVYEVESERETELFKGPLRMANWGPNLILSPDGQQIAFEAQNRPGSRTVIMPASGGAFLRELAVENNLSVRPMEWSKDGKRILVQRGIGGGRADGWWWVPVDGGAPHAMGSGLSFQIESIHPDGKQVSTTRYGSSPLNEQTGAWVDPDLLPNREGHNVFVAEFDPVSGKVRASAAPVTQSLIYSDHGAVWSPDGKSIAFGRTRSNTQRLALVERSMESGAEKIYGMNDNQNWFKTPRWFHDGKSYLIHRNQTNGSGFERLDPGKESRTLIATVDFKSSIRLAALSPDDQTLYVANNDPKTRIIVVVDLITRMEKQRFTLPNAPDPISAISLSPDGKRLAIWTEKGLSRIGVDGRGYQTLYNSPNAASANLSPIWTKDGRAILIALNERSNKWRIMRVPADGNGKPTFTGLEVEDLESLDLNPDGTRIVFDGVAPTISSGR